MKISLTLSLPLVLAGLSCSRQTAGHLGMPAPPLQVAQWIKGTPVDLAAAQGRNVIVIEYWATWCPSCRASIPHLTDLQRRFKDRGVVIVGLSNEPLETVKPFAGQMGDKMDYVVAVDDRNKTADAYMGAFGVDGIPHAFVVDKSGAIAWHGHPMAGLDLAVEAALSAKASQAASR